MKIVTKRIIGAEDLRQTCIKNKWYTRGDNQAYEKLLGMCQEPHTELTDELLTDIVLDIEAHSDLDDFMEKYNLSRDEFLEHVAFIVVNYAAVEETHCE